MAVVIADPVVTTQWLSQRLDDPDVLPVDVSWWFPHEARDAAAEFAARHIPGAVVFDVDAIADPGSDLPHMLPSPEAFAQAVGALGIGEATHVVAYESGAPRAVGRLWWMLRVFGHTRVSVLDGGLQRWIDEGRAVASGPATPSPRSFTPRFESSRVKDAAAMRDLLRDARAQIADARPANRFRGEVAEPRPGLRGGHMPGSRSLPSGMLFDDRGSWLAADALEARLRAADLDPTQPVVATCGSGLTAGLIAVALARLGRDDAAVYDGSWAEWGALPDAPIVRP